MAENIIGNKKFRILTDAAHDAWDRISYWTKASDVCFEDGTTAEQNKPINLLKRNTFYEVGDIVYEKNAPSWVMLRCVQRGTTYASKYNAPDYSRIIAPGQSITDGGAVFRVCDVRPTKEISYNECKIPTLGSLVEVEGVLSGGGSLIEPFCFGCSYGYYGFKVATSEGDIFRPFKLDTNWGEPNYSWYGTIAKNDYYSEQIHYEPSLVMYICTRNDSQVRTFVIYDFENKTGVRAYYSSASDYGTEVLTQDNSLTKGGILWNEGVLTIMSLSSSYTFYYTVLAWWDTYDMPMPVYDN